MKTNHDGTVTLNAYDTWTSCVACGQRVTGDSIHTCSPQLKQLTDEEIAEVIEKIANNNEYVYSLYEDFEGIEFSRIGIFEFARAILRKAQEK